MKKVWAQKQTGFTIVELLIVIVVIAILAAITIVSYNGIQKRSVAAVAQADLRALAQQMELFKVDAGRYPSTATIGQYYEHEKVLRAANLYQITRIRADNTQERNFIFCPYLNDDSRYTIVAVVPVIPKPDESTVGQTLYYITSDGKIKTAPMQWDSSITSSPTGKNICKSVDPTYDPARGTIWSFHIPTSNAP